MFLKRCINVRNMNNDIFGDLVPGKNKLYKVKVVPRWTGLPGCPLRAALVMKPQPGCDGIPDPPSCQTLGVSCAHVPNQSPDRTFVILSTPFFFVKADFIFKGQSLDLFRDV